MATDSTGIANLALATIGAHQIAAIGGTEREAVLSNTLYPEVLDELLSYEDWNFARHIWTLAETEDEVESDYFSYIYDFPTSPVPIMLRYAETALLNPEDDVQWQIIGAYVYSNAEDLKMVGTEQIDTVTLMPVYFQRALASLLAARLIIPLIGDEDTVKLLTRQLAGDIAQAKMMNGEEQWQTIEHEDYWDKHR